MSSSAPPSAPDQSQDVFALFLDEGVLALHPSLDLDTDHASQIDIPGSALDTYTSAAVSQQLSFPALDQGSSAFSAADYTPGVYPHDYRELFNAHLDDNASLRTLSTPPASRRDSFTESVSSSIYDALSCSHFQSDPAQAPFTHIDPRLVFGGIQVTPPSPRCDPYSTPSPTITIGTLSPLDTDWLDSTFDIASAPPMSPSPSLSSSWSSSLSPSLPPSTPAESCMSPMPEIHDGSGENEADYAGEGKGSEPVHSKLEVVRCIQAEEDDAESGNDGDDDDDDDDEYVPPAPVYKISIKAPSKRRQTKKRARASPYPLPSSSPSPASPSTPASPYPQPRSSAGTQPKLSVTRRRNVEVEDDSVIPGYEVTDDGAHLRCLVCLEVLSATGETDMLRHILTHIRPRWLCCGVPVELAAQYGVPEAEVAAAVAAAAASADGGEGEGEGGGGGAVTVFEGRRMIGGCQTLFARKDSLKRHLHAKTKRRAEAKAKAEAGAHTCFGDVEGPWFAHVVEAEKRDMRAAREAARKAWKLKLKLKQSQGGARK
ncbi:hypothetical protein C8Q77DRAFT_1152004 [Trametes polyzona]|nr:hypothetical protein C8Q77DRAFT_1152004 [Trametes polyzona]